ncbi:hypothetical protein CBR_g38339 [Chara braunii]|uniref:Uncharacterized protein n=1 Tax=Chara braunii TaxID=69332 RepID=A0A388LPX2_CHABU|nr:hypothetical protein CBR_g38339 [Chara braunii]|eukprot:GBG84367.1 hypothetical protein CBR_g38339 [Chara braunii]
MIEECRGLKKIGDTQNKGAEDSDTSYELAPAFKSVEPDISYGLAQLSETIEPDVSYELAQLFETPDLDMGCEFAQPFESVDPDVGYKLTHPFETVESDVSYELVQLFGTIEHDDDYDLVQLFEASEPDMDYELQLFETVDTYENDVESSLTTTISRDLATMKDIEGSQMDQCKSISKCEVVSIGGEFVEDCLGSQESDNPLAFDQEEEERTVMEVKFIVNADRPENMSMRIMKISGLEERLEAGKPAVGVRRFEDKDLVGTENWVAGSGIVVEIRERNLELGFLLLLTLVSSCTHACGRCCCSCFGQSVYNAFFTSGGIKGVLHSLVGVWIRLSLSCGAFSAKPSYTPLILSLSGWRRDGRRTNALEDEDAGPGRFKNLTLKEGGGLPFIRLIKSTSKRKSMGRPYFHKWRDKTKAR